MKKLAYTVFAISLVIFLFSIMTYTLWMTHYRDQVIQNNKVYAKVEVSDDKIIGFEIGDGIITYGKVVPGTNGVRNVNLKNQYNFPIIVEVKPEGKIADLLSYQETYHLNKNEEQNISIILETLPNTESGFYDGNVSFLIKRALK